MISLVRRCYEIVVLFSSSSWLVTPSVDLTKWRAKQRSLRNSSQSTHLLNSETKMRYFSNKTSLKPIKLTLASSKSYLFLFYDSLLIRTWRCHKTDAHPIAKLVLTSGVPDLP
jgi:hypothetical protein